MLLSVFFTNGNPSMDKKMNLLRFLAELTFYLLIPLHNNGKLRMFSCFLQEIEASDKKIQDFSQYNTIHCGSRSETKLNKQIQDGQSIFSIAIPIYKLADTWWRLELYLLSYSSENIREYKVREGEWYLLDSYRLG